MDEHSFANIFSSENTPISTCLIAGPNKSSLPTNNSLESTKSGRNQGKPSRDYFEDRSLINALEDYDSKIIIDIAGVGGVHSIFHALKHNDPVAQRIAEAPVLLPKKDGESVAEKYYRQYDGPLGFPLYIDLYAMSTFCDQAGLSHTAIDAAMSLICHPSPGVQILSSTTFSDPLFFESQLKKQSKEYFARHDIDTILLPVVFKYHWVAVSVSLNSAKDENIRVTIYNSSKKLKKEKIITVLDKVSNLCMEFLFCPNKKPKIRMMECSQQITINESGIHTIATLVSLARKQEPIITPLDFKELRRVYAEACCKAYVAI